MQIGFIKLHRQLLDWEWYSDINCYRLFTHLLLTVNYEPKKWQGKTIEAGQIATSREALAKQTGLSEQQLRTALTKLKSTSEITSESTNNYTLITICSWNKYQESNQPINKPITNEQQTNNKQITTTKESKKERKKEDKTKEVLSKEKTKVENLRGIRLSPDWWVSEDEGEWAVKEFNLTTDQVIMQADKFKDYWLAKAGAGGIKRDWQATWRNWIRNDIERKAK